MPLVGKEEEKLIVYKEGLVYVCVLRTSISVLTAEICTRERAELFVCYTLVKAAGRDPYRGVDVSFGSSGVVDEDAPLRACCAFFVALCRAVRSFERDGFSMRLSPRVTVSLP